LKNLKIKGSVGNQGDRMIEMQLFLTIYDRQYKQGQSNLELEKVSAYVPSCRRCVASSDVLERADMAVTKLQISLLIVNGFKNGFHQWIQRIFLVVVELREIFFRKIFLFSKFGCTLLPCSG